jgi:hypothetical protein
MEQLVTTVAEEAEHSERLLALLRGQQESLIKGDTRSIEANVREQKTALQLSRTLGHRRQQLVDTISNNGNGRGNGGKPNLAQFIVTVFNDYGHRLSQLRTSMKTSIERLSRTKEQNRMLIERSLSSIDEFRHLLTAVKTLSQEHVPGRSETRSVTPNTRIGMRQPWRRGPQAC